jgi:chromosomal replication initiator protein
MSPLADQAVSRVADRELIVTFEVLGVHSPRSGAPPNGRQPAYSNDRLDRRFTFSSFAVLKSNRLAYRSAKAFASGESSYSPLVLFGSHGTGKTHLLHAIGNDAAVSRQVVILSGEQFVDKYARAVRSGAPHTFRQAFEHCGLFLLDDFSFLSSRVASLEQFFHLFGDLARRGCGVAITTDRHPKDLHELPARVRSRIQGGLVAELSAPGEGERLELLEKKAASLKVSVSREVLRALAALPLETVTELEGSLNQVLEYARLSHREVTQELVREAVYPLRKVSSTPSAEQIIDAVCAYFNLTPDQLAGPSRARDITYPRHLAVYLLRRFCTQPLVDIGRMLGGRDHSTVISAFKRIERESTAVPETQHDISELERLLSGETSVA